MAPRVSSKLLLVGSLPASSTEEALRAGGELFGDLVFALPDGETGERAAWVGFERNRLFAPHPDIEVVEDKAGGRPRHVFEAPNMRVRPGVSSIRFDTWPRIDYALESYEIFTRLRDAGRIPAGLRFQVSLPFPGSTIIGGFRVDFTRDYPVVAAAYKDLVGRGLRRLIETIPPHDLAIQWDIAWDTLDLEGVITWTDPENAWRRFIDSSSTLSPQVPEEVLLGYHLCYGTLPEWPMFEARDMGLLVKMAHKAVETAGRRVDWIHMAGPRHLRSEDKSFFAPLAGLHLPDTRVYLGIVQPLDGLEGLRRRAATARHFLRNFGIAMYCGFGRQPGQNPGETLREHARVVKAFQSG